MVYLCVAQANWLRTQMPNGTTNVQNNLPVRASIAFHSRKTAESLIERTVASMSAKP
jgi:hypothetical protein